jgi:hypothetical protein
MDNHNSYSQKFGFPWMPRGQGPAEPAVQATRGNPNFAYLTRHIDRIKYAHCISYPLLPNAQPRASTVPILPISNQLYSILF